MREYTKEEIQQIKELHNRDELEHGCGYWSLCLEHECFCSMDAPVSKGFDIGVWDSMAESYHRDIEAMRDEMREYDEMDDDYSEPDYEPDPNDIWSREHPTAVYAVGYLNLVINQARRPPRENVDVWTSVLLRPDLGAMIVVLKCDDQVLTSRIKRRLDKNLAANMDIPRTWVVIPGQESDEDCPYTIKPVSDGIDFDRAVDMILIQGKEHVISSTEGYVAGFSVEEQFRLNNFNVEEIRYDWEKYYGAHMDTFGISPQESYRKHVIHSNWRVG